MRSVDMSMPVTPGTPDSAHMIIGTAGFVAHERRQGPKTIMNCFRDRKTSPSVSAQYIRTAANLGHTDHSGSVNNSLDATGRPEAVVLLRQLRSRPNKLTLLKSSSSRDITRLYAEDHPHQHHHIAPGMHVSNRSLDSAAAAASSSSSSGSTAAACGAPTAASRLNNNKECCAACTKRWQSLKQRMHTLEQDAIVQANYTHELELKLGELSRQVAELMHANKSRINQHTTHNNNNNNNNDRPSRLVAWMNLANWWKSRPSVESLREQHIFFDEPCFDTELELVLKHEQHATVPRIVVDCCDLIEHLYRRSNEPIEGIYRQCGDYNKIQTLRFKIDANDYDALRQSNVDIHTLTGVLKLFLREIKSPLVSVNEAKTFIGTSHQWLLTELNVKLDILQRLIRSLPECNRDTLDYIFGHFNRLTKVPLQQISAETLSLSVTPSIFHTVSQGAHMHDFQKLIREGETLSDCVKLMIEYSHRIFECSDDRRRHRLSVRNLKKALSQPDLLFNNLF